MVKAIRSISNHMILDIHLCVQNPSRFVETMHKAGASRLIFQWEAMDTLADAEELAQDIVDHSMQCGISINPGIVASPLWTFVSISIISFSFSC